jgi:hypothetical protein
MDEATLGLMAATVTLAVLHTLVPDHEIPLAMIRMGLSMQRMRMAARLVAQGSK